MLNGLDLFSGIGGISIALKPWVRVFAYCERDSYAQGVLISRMRSGELDRAPICTDILNLHAHHIRSPIDIIYGGFPCQDISAAGRGAGLEGKRSGLFFEVVRLVEEIRPSFVFLENVPAIRTRGLDQVIRAFSDLRYDCRWTCVSAAEVGAPHLRKRWFMLAHAVGGQSRNESRRSSRPSGEDQAVTGYHGNEESMAHANRSERSERDSHSGGSCKRNATHERAGFDDGGAGPFEREWWEAEPYVGRVVDGVPARVDRLRGLGNAVVPLCAKTAFERLMGFEATYSEVK